MDKDTIEKVKQITSWIDVIKENIQEVENALIEIVKREEHKYKELHPEYEPESGYWYEPESGYWQK